MVLLRTLLPLASDVDLDLDLMSDEISLVMDSVGCLAELSASPEFLVLSNGLFESNVLDGKCDLLLLLIVCRFVGFCLVLDMLVLLVVTPVIRAPPSHVLLSFGEASEFNTTEFCRLNLLCGAYVALTGRFADCSSPGKLCLTRELGTDSAAAASVLVSTALPLCIGVWRCECELSWFNV